MTKLIVGRFATYQQARNVAQELVNNNVGQDRISLVSTNYQEPDAHPSEADRTETAGGIGALTLTGAATVALWGLGAVLLAGPLALLANAQSSGLDAEEMRGLRFEQMLIDAGIATSEAEARVYVEDVRSGNSILAAEATDEQADMVADIFRRYDGMGLVFTSVDAGQMSGA